MRRFFFVASFVAGFVVLAPAGTVTLKWRAETSQAQSYQATVYRGETARLEAQLLSYGAALAIPSNATASIYYQTNGMADAWWIADAAATTNGVVSADFTPEMDAGASRYVFFLGVDGDGANYRANGVLNIRHAPGTAPNVLAPPVRWIDFATVTVSNSPWATPADVAEAVEGMLTIEADPVAGAAISAHAGRTDNPHGVTAAQIGALTSESDPVALPVAIGVSNALASTTLRSLAATDDRVDSLRIPAGPASTNLSDGRFTYGGDVFIPEGTDLDYRPDLVGWTVWSSQTIGTRRLYLWMGAGGDSTVADAVGQEVPEGLAVDTWRLWRTGSFPLFEECGAGPLPVHDLYDLVWVAPLPYYVPVAASNWVESIRGVHADIASNVVYHVVVSNGHWLIREVQ